MKAWGIGAVCVFIAAVLIARYTGWGRQFWRITGSYFNGRQSVPVWALTAALLLLVMMSVRINILLSYYSNDLYSALQTAFQGAASGNVVVRDSGVRGFWLAIWTFCIVATIGVFRIMVDLYLMQRFIIRWRVWLTHRLTGDWLDGKAYYRGRFVDTAIDNPDQRIQQDIDIFTAGVGRGPNVPSYGTAQVLLFGAVEAIANVLSFTPILWHLSGTLIIAGVAIPKALFWVLIIYVLAATLIAFWIGRPLIRLSFRNEVFNAGFRYTLVRLRDRGEGIGFYRGERAEEEQLNTRFGSIIANYRRYVTRTVAFLGWNQAASQLINPLPFIVQAPRLFAGAIKLGDVMQSGTGFNHLLLSLSFFRNAYDAFATYRAAIMRLSGLIDANEKARQLPQLNVTASGDGTMQLDSVEVRTPEGDQLIDALNLRLVPGDSLMITGPSGCGKTTLLRSLAQLWPFAAGTLLCPGGGNQTMFVAQRPYVPLGDLRAVIAYPAIATAIPDDELQRALARVGLSHLSHSLDEEQDWANTLSDGELQRVGFARILITKPKAVFLDESTSAVEEGLEYALYDVLRSDLPACIVISVSHHRALERHHNRHLELLGGGAWRLRAIGEHTAPV